MDAARRARRAGLVGDEPSERLASSRGNTARPPDWRWQRRSTATVRSRGLRPGPDALPTRYTVSFAPEPHHGRRRGHRLAGAGTLRQLVDAFCQPLAVGHVFRAAIEVCATS